MVSSSVCVYSIGCFWITVAGQIAPYILLYPYDHCQLTTSQRSLQCQQPESNKKVGEMNLGCHFTRRFVTSFGQSLWSWGSLLLVTKVHWFCYECEYLGAWPCLPHLLPVFTGHLLPVFTGCGRFHGYEDYRSNSQTIQACRYLLDALLQQLCTASNRNCLWHHLWLVQREVINCQSAHS